MINPFGAPVGDFEHPLEMLHACHERIAAQCETLHRLAAHLPAHGCDVQAQQAAADVTRYFDTAGRHHHEDEEHDLFPQLVATASGADAQRVAALVRRLRAEHEEMELAWRGLRAVLDRLARGESAALEPPMVEKFSARYRAHIAVEETELYPCALRLLPAGTLAAIGERMRRRRGANPFGP